MENKFLFKRDSDGAYIYGPNNRCTCPSGIFRKKPTDDFLALTITNVYTGMVEDSKLPIGNFLDKDGIPYPTLDDLETAVEGFFFRNVVGSTGNSQGFYELELAGTDGDFVDGERTGIVKDFELPAAADIAKSMIVFDGLNFIKDYTLEEVEGVKWIKFILAPLANSSVFYQK